MTTTESARRLATRKCLSQGDRHVAAAIRVGKWHCLYRHAARSFPPKRLLSLVHDFPEHFLARGLLPTHRRLVSKVQSR